LLRARGARDYQPAAEVLPVGEALPPRPRQVNRLLEKLGRAKCPIIGAARHLASPQYGEHEGSPAAATRRMGM